MNKLKTSINLTRNISLSIALIAITLVPVLNLSNKRASAATTLPAYKYSRSFDTTNGNAYTQNVTSDKSGNVFITGTFYGAVNFNPGNTIPEGQTGSSTLFSSTDDVFVTKYNSDGSYQWTKTLTNSESSYSYSYGISTDSHGNVLVYGDFNGTVSLPGINGFTKTSPTSNLIFPALQNNNQYISNIHPKEPSSNYVIFLVSFDTNGNTNWSNVANNNGTGNIGAASMSIDSNNNIYTAGSFCGTVNFTPSEQVTSTNCSSYVAKYNDNGIYQSILYNDSSSNTYDNTFTRGTGIATDNKGNFYVTGFFMGTIGFNYDGTNPGTDPITNINITNPTGFLTKYNSNGTYAWTKTNSIESGVVNIQTGVATDLNNNVYAVGMFAGNTLFDNSDSQNSSDNGSNESAYLTKYDNSGNYKYTKIITNQTGSNLNDYSWFNSVATDPLGGVYTGGQFSGEALLDGPNGTADYTSLGSGTNETSIINKYNSDGSYVWSKVHSSDTNAGDAASADSYISNLNVDSFGNLYSAGYYTGPVFFNGINNSDENDSTNTNSFLTKWQVYTPTVVTPNTPNTPSTGFAKGNNANQIILYSSLFIALSLITGGYLVNKRNKN